MPRQHGSDPSAAQAVLVVEDDAAVRRVLARHLARRGMRVVEAGSVADALLRLAEDSFDLVVTDLSLPGRPGTWLIGDIKARFPGLPVLVVTGALPAGADAAKVELADGVLGKPVEFAELDGELARLCGPF